MRFTVPAIIMCTIGALLSIVLGVQPVLAACTEHSQCPSDMLCLYTLLGTATAKECKRYPCNADSECPSDRPCTLGYCTAPASSGGGGGGGGPSGVGGACGQVKIGGVMKPKGCKPGLQCVKPASSNSGTCQKPLQ
jgi:hypothetical protein